MFPLQSGVIGVYAVQVVVMVAQAEIVLNIVDLINQKESLNTARFKLAVRSLVIRSDILQ
jgi:hypothetical protein